MAEKRIALVVGYFDGINLDEAYLENCFYAILTDDNDINEDIHHRDIRMERALQKAYVTFCDNYLQKETNKEWKEIETKIQECKELLKKKIMN